MKGIDDASRDFVQLFERLGLTYVLMGGLAVRIHALPRPTFDVDFTAALPREELPALYDAVREVGYEVPEAQATGWLDSVRGFPVAKFQWLVSGRPLDVDVFLAETPFQQQLLQRRERRRANGFDAWFVTAEDLVLLKLLASRPKDLVDVADILFIQGELDHEHMRTWAVKLGIADRLEAALRRQ